MASLKITTVYSAHHRNIIYFSKLTPAGHMSAGTFVKVRHAERRMVDPGDFHF